VTHLTDRLDALGSAVASNRAGFRRLGGSLMTRQVRRRDAMDRDDSTPRTRSHTQVAACDRCRGACVPLRPMASDRSGRSRQTSPRMACRMRSSSAWLW
jgi:hypothetical protein